MSLLKSTGNFFVDIIKDVLGKLITGLIFIGIMLFAVNYFLKINLLKVIF